MYTLVLFYVLASKFHTDVSNVVVNDFRQKEWCESAQIKIAEAIKVAHPDVAAIQWTCVQTEKN